jgi:hypothetical protein
MSCNSKLLCLVLAFALLGAAFASSASATFHSEIQSTYLSGQHKAENTFTTSAGKVQCKSATFKSPGGQIGVYSGTDWEMERVTLHPTYSECKAFGLAATIETGSCDYEIIGAATNIGQLNIVGTLCEMRIIVPVGKCEIDISSQQPGERGLELWNEGTGSTRSVLMTWKVGKILYWVSPPGVSPCGSSGFHSDGAYGGSALIKGYNATFTVQVGFWSF